MPGTGTLCLWWAADVNGEYPDYYFPPLVISQSAEQIATLCRGFNDTQTKSMEGPRESQDPPPRPLARHLSDADRLRKVIQELVDTEKSYVKVTGSGGHSLLFADGKVCASRGLRSPLPQTPANHGVGTCS